jgi:hypothetical protein
MEKLIKLLNEYRKEKYPKSKLRYYKYDSLNNEFLSNCIPNDPEEKVLGKRFGFIKWLVEKDKVDMFDIANYIAFHNNYAFVATRELKDRNIDEDHLIMLLSIQEKPLQLLIQFLK